MTADTTHSILNIVAFALTSATAATVFGDNPHIRAMVDCDASHAATACLYCRSIFAPLGLQYNERMQYIASRRANQPGPTEETL